jgi:EAL domain-containing protein (putative c-di-GMP-specific phosphodiesterase class I)
LGDLGVTFSIDDFGTGYSSLSYLKGLPAGEIKIDKSFVRDMVRDEHDATIVRSVIDLAHNLGRVTVAEGVEDMQVWQALTALGCDKAQGFWLARPMPVRAFDEWLAAWPWGVVTPDGRYVPEMLAPNQEVLAQTIERMSQQTSAGGFTGIAVLG